MGNAILLVGLVPIYQAICVLLAILVVTTVLDPIMINVLNAPLAIFCSTLCAILQNAQMNILV